MKDTIYISYHNAVHLLVTASDRGIEKELAEHFQFQVPGFKFMPAYKNGMWDGYIRLYNLNTNTIYTGLFRRIVDFAKSKNYHIECDYSDFAEREYSIQEAQEFIKSLNLPKEITPYDYQIESLISSVRHERQTILAPTGSGKSLIIYLIARYWNLKTLIIVPIVSLVGQLENDFKDYGYTDDIHTISGKDKSTDKLITITTWQSIYRQPRKFFDSYDVVIVDETHGAKAKSITSILEKMPNCKKRIGLTGSLDGTACHMWVIEGLLGPINRVAKTHELQERKILADLSIRCLIMHYSEKEKMLTSGFSYQDEIEYIIKHKARNEFIKKLALSLKGNTLILFQRVEKHGHILYDMIKNSTDNNVYYIHGGISGDERNAIRAKIEKEDNSIIIASVGSFATGTNIKKLNNIIFTSPSKAKIRIIQSIGRVLRKMKLKSTAVLYDIADNLVPKDKKRMNYTLVHFLKRLQIYKEEKHRYKIHNIKLDG